MSKSNSLNMKFQRKIVSLLVIGLLSCPTAYAYYSAPCYGCNYEPSVNGSQHFSFDTYTKSYQLRNGNYTINGNSGVEFYVKSEGDREALSMDNATLEVHIPFYISKNDSGYIQAAILNNSTLTTHKLLEISNSLKLTNSTISGQAIKIHGLDTKIQSGSLLTASELTLTSGSSTLIENSTVKVKKLDTENEIEIINGRLEVTEELNLLKKRKLNIDKGSTLESKLLTSNDDGVITVTDGSYHVKESTLKGTRDNSLISAYQFYLGNCDLKIDNLNISDYRDTRYSQLFGLYVSSNNLNINPYTLGVTPTITVNNISGSSTTGIIFRGIEGEHKVNLNVTNITGSKPTGIEAYSPELGIISGFTYIDHIKDNKVQYKDEESSHLNSGDFGTAVGIIGSNLTLTGGLYINNIKGRNNEGQLAIQHAVIGKKKDNQKYEDHEPIRIGTWGKVTELDGTSNFDLCENSINIIHGDIYAYDVGIEAAFATSGLAKIPSDDGREDTQFLNSKFIGRATREKNIPLELLFKNNGTWQVTADSDISALRVLDKGIVDLTSLANQKNPKVKTQWLQGSRMDSENAGTIKMHFDIEDQNNSSQIITNAATGKLNIELSLDNYVADFKKAEVPLIIENPVMEDGSIFQVDGDKLITQLTYKDGAVLAPKLKFFETETDNTANGKDQSTGNGGWYPVVQETKPDAPTPDSPNSGLPPSSLPEIDSDNEIPVTPEVNQVLALASSNAFGLGLLHEIEDLRTRLGDVRYGSLDGIWARTYSLKDRFSDGTHSFKQESYGLHLGVDHLIDQNLLVGLAFNYGVADQDTLFNEYKGNGELEQYTLKGYGTYFTPEGAYLNIVGTVGRLQTELKGINNPKDGQFKARFNNTGFGISTEIGRRLELGQWLRGKWYVEPSGQFSWFHIDGTDFETSSGMKVSQSDVNFFTGRLGTSTGTTIPLGNEMNPMAKYLNIGVQLGVLYQFDSNQSISAKGTDGAKIRTDAMNLDGARAYYGLSMDWQTSDALRYYGKISRQEGSGYTREYEISVGLRCTF